MTGDLFPLPAEEVVANIAAQQIAELHKRIRELLKYTGQATTCRGARCGKAVYMVRHHDGRMMPYNFDGVSHFLTCVDAPRVKTKGATNAR